MDAPKVMNAGCAPCKALVIEGDRDLLQSLCEVLGACGFDAATAETGERAIAQLERGLEPDLVLLDLQLPRMSGDEVLRHLKEDGRWRHVPVAAMSAHSRRLLEVLPLADAILLKPFTLEMLEEVVTALATRTTKAGSLEPASQHGASPTDAP